MTRSTRLKTRFSAAEFTVACAAAFRKRILGCSEAKHKMRNLPARIARFKSSSYFIVGE
jgi:hypothetical protein